MAAVRRFILGCVVLLVGMAGVFVYDGITEEREFQRLTTAGDQAVVADQAFLAIEAYSGALALHPDSMAIYLKRGEIYQRQSDFQAAAQDLTMAARLDPTATRPHESLGDVSVTLESYAEAVQHYRDYVRLDDQNPRVLYKLALVSQRSGRVARAVPLLRQAIALDDQFVEAYYLLGLCLTEQGRLKESRDVLEAAVEQSPGFLDAREVLAGVYRSLGDQRAELQHLDALAALDRTNPQRHVARGLAYARAGQTELAVLALGRAAEEHPDQPQVYEALGRVWFEIAESRQDHVARGKALEALSLIPTTAASSTALTLLGRVRLLDGDTDGAVRALRQAVERFPVAPDAYLELANLEERAWHWENANLLRRQHRALTSSASAGRPGGTARPSS